MHRLKSRLSYDLQSMARGRRLEQVRSYAIGDVVQLPDGRFACVRQVRRGRIPRSLITRLRLTDRSFAYLKEGKGEAAVDLEAEFKRLKWLKQRLPVPAVHRLKSGRGEARILLSGLPGRPAHQARLTEPRRVEVLAEALLQIHAIPAVDCPFRDTLDYELAEAEQRLVPGRLDRKTFLESTNGLTPEQTLDELQRTRGIIAETVFTHGDYCLPNVMIQNGRLSGVLDWGIAGVGDPHRDFMAVRDSLDHNLGEIWVDRFFDAYGGPRPDPERIRYYTLLDQFFAHHVG